jgi:hypothetical protein
VNTGSGGDGIWFGVLAFPLVAVGNLTHCELRHATKTCVDGRLVSLVFELSLIPGKLQIRFSGVSNVRKKSRCSSLGKMTRH